MFPRYNNLYLQNHLEINNLYMDIHHQLWIIQSNHRIVHEYLHKSKENYKKKIHNIIHQWFINIIIKNITVTGASTLWTLLSSINISRALSHIIFTSDSFKYSHFFNRSICSSKLWKDVIFILLWYIANNFFNEWDYIKFYITNRSKIKFNGNKVPDCSWHRPIRVMNFYLYETYINMIKTYNLEIYMR